jgi:dienelactone hydrolase
MLQAAPTFGAVIDSLRHHDYLPDSTNISTLREALWQRYLYGFERDSLLQADFEAGICRYAPGKQGRFSMKVVGARPDHGYPVYIGLHGGGGAPAEVNDAQWEQMQQYYLKSIDTGIYVAPRGPSNNWNLHFDDDAQAFYNHLLADLRCMAGADPDRIYILGYSAGGDGVYQLAPRMAPQLAAASMSAGHHNGVSPVNLQHVPMLLQVGELDAAYDRNLETVRYARLLDSLEKQFSGDYRHQVYVHAGAEHSYVRDRQGAHYLASVLGEPSAWLVDREKSNATLAVTDAVAWLKPYCREPFPQHLHWDTRTSLQGDDTWYWLSTPSGAIVDRSTIADAHFEKGQNRIIIEEFVGQLQIHVHERMVDSRRPLIVVVRGKDYLVTLRPSMLEMAISIERYADESYGFWQMIDVSEDMAQKITVR